MDLKIKIEDYVETKDPITSNICFPVTENVQTTIRAMTKSEKTKLNRTVRSFLDAYLVKCVKKDSDLKQE